MNKTCRLGQLYVYLFRTTVRFLFFSKFCLMETIL